MDAKMIGLLVFIALFIGAVVVFSVVPFKKKDAEAKPKSDG